MTGVLRDNKTEIKMSKVITMSELQYLPPGELAAMQRQIRDALTRSAAGSAERRNALASLENINRVLNMRRALKAPSM